MSRLGVLAEGQEPGSNTLFCRINDLQTTRSLVDVAWRILGLLSPFPSVRTEEPVRTSSWRQHQQ
jgi:hypothetical protein